MCGDAGRVLGELYEIINTRFEPPNRRTANSPSSRLVSPIL